MAARGFIGAGDLYISRYDTVAQAFGPLAGPYECSKFEIKPNVNVKELSSRGKSTYGQVIESVAQNQPADFTAELPEVNKESLTIALLGTTEDLTQTAQTIAAEEVVATALDQWIKLAHGNLSATVSETTVKNEAGTTTYVEGTDYTVNRTLGLIKPITGGEITEGEQLKVGYKTLAGTSTLIRGATQSQLRAQFVLDGINTVDGSKCVVTIYEAVVAPDAAFDFMGEDFATVSLPGRLKTPTGRTEPFTVEVA